MIVNNIYKRITVIFYKLYENYYSSLIKDTTNG